MEVVTLSQTTDLVPFLALAVAENPRALREAEKIYREHEAECCRLARESAHFDHYFFTQGTPEREVACRKALGAVLWAASQPDAYNVLDTLVKKGWPAVASWLAAHDRISPGAYLKSVYGGQIPKSDDALNSEVLVLLWWASVSGREIDTSDGLFRVFERQLQGMALFCEPDSPLRFRREAMKEEDVFRARRALRDVFGTDRISRIKDIEDAALKKECVAVWLQGQSLMFDSEALSLGALLDGLSFSRADLEEVAGAFLAQQEENTPVGDDLARFVLTGIVIKGLLRRYKEAKELALSGGLGTGAEARYWEEKAGALERENASLKARVENLEKKAASEYARAASEYAAEVRDLKKRVAEMETALAEAEKDRQELSALREMLFRMQQKEPPPEGAPPQVPEDFRGVVVGGHPRWQEKMREHLPSFAFLDAGGNFDPGVIAGAGMVYFFAPYLSHAAYDKAVAEARRSGVPVGYISSRNVDLALREVAEQARGQR